MAAEVINHFLIVVIGQSSINRAFKQIMEGAEAARVSAPGIERISQFAAKSFKYFA